LCIGFCSFPIRKGRKRELKAKRSASRTTAPTTRKKGEGAGSREMPVQQKIRTVFVELWRDDVKEGGDP